MIHSPNAELMLARRLRRRPNINPTLVQCIVFAGQLGGGPRVVVSTAAFHARVRGSVPGLGGFKETKMFLPHPRVKVSIVGSLRDREVACSASDRQGSNFESCVWRTVSSQSSHHPQEVLLAQFSLYVHKGGLKPDSFHFIFLLGSCYSQQTQNICITFCVYWETRGVDVGSTSPALDQQCVIVLFAGRVDKCYLYILKYIFILIP